VFAVVPDERGDVWMSSEKDLVKIQVESRTKRVYGPEDGLQGGRFGFGSAVRCRSGEIVFGGAAGVNVFRPDEIRDNPYLPPVAVMSINLSSPPETIPLVDRRDEVTVPKSRLPLRVRVTALSFSHPDRQRFRVHMTSPEDRVFELGTERILRLDSLKPGPNRFVFYAANHDQVWNPEGLDMTIRVTVPFWRSPIVQLVMAALLAISLGSWLRRRRRFLKQRLLHQIKGDLGPLSERFDLTKREQEILALILQGKSNKDIEAQLYISGKTVKNHVYNLYQKLGVKNRLELANAVREFAEKNRPPADR
jgi:DNA-binding CsgD family transcriptional regulator